MIARILRQVGDWLDTIAEGTDDALTFWPPACDVWITSFDPACVPPKDPDVVLRGTPVPPAEAILGVREATP
jgi:hypothetical protein